MLRYGDANIRRPAGVALVEACEGLRLFWRPPADPDVDRAFNQFGGESLEHVGFQRGVHYLETSRGRAHLISRFMHSIDTSLRGRQSRRNWSPALNWTHCCQRQNDFTFVCGIVLIYAWILLAYEKFVNEFRVLNTLNHGLLPTKLRPDYIKH